MGTLRSPRLLVGREDRRDERVDRAVQRSTLGPTRDIDLVARHREGEGIHARLPEDIRQLRDQRFARLIPGRVHRREPVISPQTVRLTGIWRGVLPIVVRVPEQNLSALRRAPVDTGVDLLPLDRGVHRTDPVVAVAFTRNGVRLGIELQ